MQYPMAMNNQIPSVPYPVNEPVTSFAPGTPERASLRKRLADMRQETFDIPAIIGGQEIRTGRTFRVVAPHDHALDLGRMHKTGPDEVEKAVAAARDARKEWAELHWTDRAAVFLKAAELLAGPWRDTINAATMLGQSKNTMQSEIDAACELIDFCRFNVHFAEQIYSDQPISDVGIWNRSQYRPLEGFVFAVAPFNFTSIAANLFVAPALMGNTVLWKPSSTSILSAYHLYKLFEAAGLPPGVVNMLPGDGPTVGDPVFAHPEFAGIHFTGSTATFQHMWRTMGSNIETYRSYPRIVGETGGKDFILMHPDSDPTTVATAIVRGAFEYQGQKCSAASRVYIPKSQWNDVRESLTAQLSEITVGPVEDFTNFMNAVIDQKAFDKITGYIEHARSSSDAEIIAGGTYSDKEGWFIDPTVILAKDPGYKTMCEEIFGPVVTIHVYEDQKFSDMIRVIDTTSPYALTGAIFARDRRVIAETTAALSDNAGNFYINDKPTGAVVGQQPFGGARGSGTNDKAGSYMNLLRWVSARSIKENFSPPTHFAYPFHQPDPTENPIT